MFRPRVIPCLLLRDQGLVKTIAFQDPKYIGDPINAVKIFNDAKADELVFLDITATKEKRPPRFEIIQEIGEEAFMPFAVGGGITDLRQIEQLIKSGAEKIVLNTIVYQNPAIIEEAAKVFGSQSIIVSIDASRSNLGHYDLYSTGGSQKEAIRLQDHVKRIEDLGAGEILVNSIDNEGRMEGYDHVLIKQTTASTSIPVIACGGASHPSDFYDVIVEDGASAVAAGSIFVYIGKSRAVMINYPEPSDLMNLFT